MTQLDLYRSISYLFRPKTISDAVINDNFSVISNKLSRFKQELGIDGSSTFADGFRIAYNLISKNYPNEYFYKSSIFNKYILGRYSVKTASLFSEIRLGGSIADLIIVNGVGTVFEIKTELDTPKRLVSQVNNYYKVLPHVNVIIPQGELDKYIHVLPKTCGIILRTNRNTFRTVRECLENTQLIQSREIFKCFRKSEYIEITKEFINDIDSIPNTKIFTRCLNEFKKFSVDAQLELLYTTLKRRKSEISNRENFKSYPKELNYIFYTKEFKESQIKRFTQSLNSKIQ
ncbi:MAG: sce7726 family protein [Bacteroidetes bacterium]|nr:sce7726 family protein [Bacteroidota bacterium]